MTAVLAHTESDSPYVVSTTGEHSFATGIPGQRALVSLALTGAQVAFLVSNPAAVRCCLAKAAFGAEWLDQLMASVSAIGSGLDPAPGVH